MSSFDDVDRIVELPAESLDDLDPLQATTAGPPEQRAVRTQIVTRPLPLDQSGVFTRLGDQEQAHRIERELASRRLSIERREQRHRHVLEVTEQRHIYEHRQMRGRQEARIIGAVLMLVVTSGIAWITMPATDAAQIVFTTSFGAVAGYLGGRSRRGGDSRG